MDKDRSYKYFMEALNNWLSHKGNNRAVLADKCDCTRGHITQQLNKKNGGFANFETQLKIAKACGYSYLAFLQRGKNLIEGKPPNSIHPAPLTVQTRNSHEQNLLKKTIPDYIGVPLYTSGRVAAWSNGTAFDQYEDPASEVLVYTPELGHRAKHHLVAAKVGGDSMEPLVPKDSIIIVDMDDKEFVDNKIFAVVIDDGGVKTLAVKRVRKFQKAKGFVLWSEKQDYQPVLVIESDWLRLCVGRVIWMWRSLEG